MDHNAAATPVMTAAQSNFNVFFSPLSSDSFTYLPVNIPRSAVTMAGIGTLANFRGIM